MSIKPFTEITQNKFEIPAYSIRCCDLIVDRNSNLGPITTTNLTVDNLIVNASASLPIGSLNPHSLNAGANGAFLKTSATLPTWSFLTAADIPAGNNNEVLITNGLGVVEWSDNVTTNDITALNSLNSLNNCNFDNVDIASTLTVNNVPPVANQLLGTDGLGTLGWQPIPVVTPSLGRSIYYANQPQDINSAPSLNIQFGFGYNGLVGQITRLNTTDFQCDTAGTYQIEFAATVVASSSSNLVEITVNGGPFAPTYYNPASNYAGCRTILSLPAGAIIRVRSTRQGVDATAKNIYPLNSSSYIQFSRVV